MSENKNITEINAKSRPIVRNWIIKISDIRRILIRSTTESGNTYTEIEVRYNCWDGYKYNNNDGLDTIPFPKDIIVNMFYKILKCIKRCKKPKDDYLIITENDISLLSETNITGI